MRELSFEEVWEQLEGPSRQVHEALLDAISNADRLEVLHPELCRDGVLWSMNVRAYLATVLPVVVNPDDFTLERGFNISLTLRGRTVSVRIRKADPGQMPQPGDSPGSRMFFNQDSGQGILPGTEPGDPESKSRSTSDHAPHFVYKWSVNESRQLCELDLGYPKPTFREIGEADPQEWYWVKPIFDMTRPSFGETPGLFTDLDVPGLELRSEDEDKGEGTGTV
jgi:hypothetical protein